ncbi:MAG: hypothetical protein JWL72_835 [Ilumatobacteraceae bacterium]|nr:hypothetical protein [Ilumatobacteraceae bacterium]
MMKRVTWFVSGAVAGVAGAGYAKRKVKETASQLAPANVAKAAVAKVRHRSADVADAVRDGRDAMRAKEAELRARLHGSAEIVEAFEPEDLVLVDGHRVEPDQVIVLRPARDEHSGPRRHSRRTHRGA